MGRDLQKSTANRINHATATMKGQMNGAPGISAHAWVTADTLSTTDALSNQIVSGWMDSPTAILFVMNVRGVTSRVLRCAARSKTADANQVAIGTTTLSTGTRYSCGAVADFGADKVRIYLNGANEADTAVTFGDSTLTAGANSPDNDIIGSSGVTATDAWDGEISELALWAGVLTLADYEVLNKGVSPLLVRPDILASYVRLLGSGTEIDLMDPAAVNIVGTVGQRDHPRMYYPT